VSEVIMTDSVDTWETLETSLTNSTDADREYTLTMVAKNASGYAAFDPIIRVQAFQRLGEVA
jgi:hypothetical protein